MTEFFSLGEISDILHIPVPFLEEWDFLKQNYDDEKFYPLKSSEIQKLKEQRNRFRRCFKNLVGRIMTLIDHDSSVSGSQPTRSQRREVGEQRPVNQPQLNQKRLRDQSSEDSEDSKQSLRKLKILKPF